MHVGLLEDDIAIQEMLFLVLQDEGYSVANFPSAEVCLNSLCKLPEQDKEMLAIDLLIIDWRLQDVMTGTEVICKLRKHPDLQDLPIILTTAAALNDLGELQHLRITFLEKPFSVDDMTALIKQLTQPSASV